jgi:intracellular septation protein
MSTPAARELPQGIKLALDFAPLLGFFVAYKLGGVYWATGAIILLTLASLVAGYAMTGRLAKFPLYSGILITIMGGLTLYLQNDAFVKMKPTAANLVFAIILGGGLLANRIYLKDLLGSSISLPETAWRTLTWRWTAFFLALAAANEYVWRNLGEETWVNFKVFGLMGLTFLFVLANLPFMARHMKDETTSSAEDQKSQP